MSEASAEDRPTQSDPSAPRDQDQSKSPLACHRQIARQATSAVAYSAEPPSLDDPLLDFEPVPHKQPRRNSITPDLQREFIAHLAATGIVKAAAKHIGKSMEAIYKLRQRPGAEGFNAAWEEALQWGVLRLEDCAIERAIHEGLSNKRANSLLAFILAYRSHHRVDERHIVPGHPIYEQIRDEVLEEEMLV
ncbi:hypothetical protein [Erythrobacter sp. THAF29]|uniref:hypothetical protein n=1 Tax=Erythrobacter sp. THAF29 TaxID=2587851 RepID=UPI001268EDB2|nr:hypothetical protein [Erythrobacter sp. THAF29]